MKVERQCWRSYWHPVSNLTNTPSLYTTNQKKSYFGKLRYQPGCSAFTAGSRLHRPKSKFWESRKMRWAPLKKTKKSYFALQYRTWPALPSSHPILQCSCPPALQWSLSIMALCQFVVVGGQCKFFSEELPAASSHCLVCSCPAWSVVLHERPYFIFKFRWFKSPRARYQSGWPALVVGSRLNGPKACFWEYQYIIFFVRHFAIRFPGDSEQPYCGGAHAHARARARRESHKSGTHWCNSGRPFWFWDSKMWFWS